MPERRNRDTLRARKDLIAIAVIVIVVCGVVLADPDRFFEWLAQRKEAKFDEFLVEIVTVGTGFAIFSWRRWADLSRQVAEYKRLQKELSAINKEASLLSDTDDLLQSCLSSTEAYQIVIRHLNLQFPGYSGAICVIHPDRDSVETQAVWGTPALSDRTFHPQDCWALRRGRVSILRENTSALTCAHIGSSVPSYAICVPMMAQGETLGVLCLDSGKKDATRTDEPQDALSESQERMVKTLAEHLSLAIANLNLRESLRIQSIRDPLTNLFNRRYMEESLDIEVRRSGRKDASFGLMMLDVDHFKQFNDSFGHDAGDFLLQDLARLFLDHLRAEDIVCRYGGEEFALILPETELEPARMLAEALCQVVRLHDVQYRGRPLGCVRISIGLAAFPKHGHTQDALLRSADRALYRAKNDGRDRVVIA